MQKLKPLRTAFLPSSQNNWQIKGTSFRITEGQFIGNRLSWMMSYRKVWVKCDVLTITPYLTLEAIMSVAMQKQAYRANDCADPNLEQSCSAVNVSQCFNAAFLKEEKKNSVTPCIKCTDIKDSVTSKQVRHKLLPENNTDCGLYSWTVRGFNASMCFLKWINRIWNNPQRCFFPLERWETPKKVCKRHHWHKLVPPSQDMHQCCDPSLISQSIYTQMIISDF